jgi:hypothetical protein
MRLLFTVCLTSITYMSHADELRLVNDSPYVLYAQVQNSHGVVVGEVSVPASGESTWSNWNEPFSDQFNYSQTPYNVNWYCPDGTLYSACVEEAAAATVVANGCDGPHVCKSKTKPQDMPVNPAPAPEDDM